MLPNKRNFIRYSNPLSEDLINKAQNMLLRSMSKFWANNRLLRSKYGYSYTAQSKAIQEQLKFTISHAYLANCERGIELNYKQFIPAAICLFWGVDYLTMMFQDFSTLPEYQNIIPLKRGRKLGQKDKVKRKPARKPIDKLTG